VSLYLEEKIINFIFSVSILTFTELVNSHCLSSLREREKRIGNTIWSTTKWFSDQETILYLLHNKNNLRGNHIDNNWLC